MQVRRRPSASAPAAAAALAVILTAAGWATAGDKVAPGPVLVVAPHPDDETLGCGGLIAQRRSEGRRALAA